MSTHPALARWETAAARLTAALDIAEALFDAATPIEEPPICPACGGSMGEANPFCRDQASNILAPGRP